MWKIIRNGIRRWWWIYLIATIGSVFAVMDTDSPQIKIALHAGVIIYAGIMLFAFEIGGFNKFRLFNMLPVSAMRQGRAFGVLFAGVAAGINITVYLLGAAVYIIAPQLVPPPVSLTLYVVIVFFSIGIVCLFMQSNQQSGRFTHGWRMLIWEIFTQFYGLLIFALACYFVYRFGLEKQSALMPQDYPFAWIINGITNLIGRKKHLFDLPDCIVLGIAATGIALTFFRADSFGRYLSNLALQRKENSATFLSPVSTRSYGFFESWVQEAQSGARTILVIVFALGCGGLFLSLLSGKPFYKHLSSTDWPLVLIIVIGLICIPPILPWFAGLRTLRMLPFSRKTLALYLMSFPFMAFLAYSGILLAVCTYFQDLNYALNLEWCMMVVFGLSMLANSLLLMSRHAFFGFIVLLMPTVAAALIFSLPADPIDAIGQTSLLYKFAVGTILFTTGYLSLYATIAHNTPYRAKPWFGC